MDINNSNIFLGKQLTKTDKERQLIVTNDLLDKFPIEQGYERDLVAFDQNGKEWRFKLAIRQTGNYAKPILKAPKWHEFVVEHFLNRDDGKEYGVCFYTTQNEPNKLQVRALKRHFYLLGQPIWGVV